MRFNQQWLEEKISTQLQTDDLVKRFTMAGLEIDVVEPVAKPFTHVVVAQVTHIEAHPDAKKLNITQVDAGDKTPYQVVCGAANVAKGMKVAFAKIGAVIGDDFKIKEATLRGVQSYGMLCSAKELGLAESSEGILALSEDAPIGEDFRDYLQLDDTSIELELTPNRGDCLSIEGLARETATLFDCEFISTTHSRIETQCDATLDVTVQATKDCPRYVGRIIRNIDLNQHSPLWLQEKLRRCGLRSIDPVVDVTNYVLLELGQPLHAFDSEKIQGGIVVRKAHSGESITLLDKQIIELDDESLVIADHKGPLALAGIMGGLDSGVSADTQHIFLESAFFAPEHIAGRARRYGLHTDSSHRFERGVDYMLQVKGIERATELLLSIVGGKPGPIIEVKNDLPQEKNILLRTAQVPRILGTNVEPQKIECILQHLGMKLSSEKGGWQVTIPSFRFDIIQEIDLIEEIARVYGYESIPSHRPKVALKMQPATETKLSELLFAQVLVDRDYCEAINYSFVDPTLQKRLYQKSEAIHLVNPISADLGVMRQQLWPGLIKSFLHNINRQQPRIRLFERGLTFIKEENEIIQKSKLGGLCWGAAFRENWSTQSRPVDFFDCKSDVESLLALTGCGHEFEFRPIESHPLHPGQSASVVRKGEIIGQLGALHPEISHALEIPGNIFLFELDLDSLIPAKLPNFAKLSKYPSIRRDIAIWVDRKLPAATVCNAIKDTIGNWLVDIHLFDVYLPEAEAERKSLAFGFTLQHSDRTLIDIEINELVYKVENVLEDKFAASVRK